MTITIKNVNNAGIIIEVLSLWMAQERTVVVRWVDNEGTGRGFDILLSIPARLGDTEYHNVGNLVVAIMNYGSFSFPVNSYKITTEEVAKVLNVHNKHLTEFINGIISTLYQMKK